MYVVPRLSRVAFVIGYLSFWMGIDSNQSFSFLNFRKQLFQTVYRFIIWVASDFYFSLSSF